MCIVPEGRLKLHSGRRAKHHGNPTGVRVLVDYLKIRTALARGSSLHIVDILFDGCNAPHVLPRRVAWARLTVVFKPVLILVVQRITEEGHTELGSQSVGVGSIGCYDDFASFLGDKIVDSISLGLVYRLLWGYD